MSFSRKRFRRSLRRRGNPHPRLRLERLEARRLLATYFVTTTDDDPAGICVADDQAASLSCSIRSAIAAAETNPGPDEITIPDGTYLLDLQLGSLDVDETAELSLIGNTALPQTVVIDGQANDRIFDVLSILPNRLTLAGLTLQNGRAADGSGGGGIQAGTSDLVVDNSILRNNVADLNSLGGGSSSGGAIQGSGNITVTNSQILDNQATEHGGGIDFGPFAGDRTLTITDTTISANQAAIDGGGIFVDGDGTDSTVSVGRSTLENNQTEDSGGGLFVLQADVEIFESTFQLNAALGTNNADGVGGGFYIRSDAGTDTFDIRQSTFAENTAAGGGGGAIFENADGAIASSDFTDNSVTRPGSGPNVFVEGGGGFVLVGLTRIPAVTADQLTVRANNGPAGAGIAVVDTDLTLTGSTVTGNTATNPLGGGGGIGAVATTPAGSNLDVSNSTVENNTTAGEGGGIGAIDVDVDLNSVVIRQNSADGGRAGGLGILGRVRAPATTIGLSTIQNNTASSDGGGIYAPGPLTIDQTTVADNTADGGSGGGIYFGAGLGGNTQSGNNDSLLVTDSTISGNRSGGSGGFFFSSGGGVAIEPALNANVEARFVDTTIDGNVTTDSGGGIDSSGMPLFLIRSVVSNNATDLGLESDGGGIFADGDITIQETSFSGNTARDFGGAFVYTGGNLTVTDSTFSQNQGGDGGGAFYMQSDFDINATLTDVLFELNQSMLGQGGAIEVEGDDPAVDRLTIRRTTFAENTAAAEGGAMHLSLASLAIDNSTFSQNTTSAMGGALAASGSQVDIRHATITLNSADLGGGLQHDDSSTVTVGNSVIAGNSATNGDPDVRGLFTSNDGNLVGDIGTASGFSGEFDRFGGSGGSAPLDPQLGPLILQDPADKTPTHLPLTGSPLIDAAADPASLPSDQRQVTRPLDGDGDSVAIADIGAVEAEQVTPTPTLTLGDTVWNDLDNSGTLDPGEPGLANVPLNLYQDSDGNGILSSQNDSLIASTLTDINGLYAFANLAPGDYFVLIPDSAFFAGAVLEGFTSSTGNDPAPDPDLNPSNLDDNGSFDTSTSLGVVSAAVTLAVQSEPTNDGDGDANTNLTVDFGLFVLPGPDLDLTKSASAAAVDAGETVQFTLQVSNLGSSVASEVSISDVLPAGLSFVAGSGTGGAFTEANGTVSVSVGDLVPGSIQLLQFSAEVAASASGSLTNTATASLLGLENNLTNNTASVTLLVGGGGGIQGHLFCDANGNVQEDPGEQSVGVTLFADLNGNRRRDPQEPFGVTDANGDYFIGSVPPGSVEVISSLPTGCNTVSPSAPRRSTLGVGDLARSIVAADVDLDGDIDLVVTNELSSDLVILQNDGNAFSIARRIPLAERPRSVTVWQPDGMLPTFAVAAVGSAESKGTVYLIEPSGTTTLAVGDGPLQVLLDDFNDDAQPDLLTSAFRSSELSLLLSGSDAPIQLARGRNLLGSAIGDLNGDGQKDIVLGGAGYGGDDQSEIKVLLGNGDGTFAEGPTIQVAKDVVQVTAIDLDDDGRDEVVALAKSGNLVSLRLESSGGTGIDQLVVIRSTTLDPGVNAFAVGNFNQDDRIDVAVTNLNQQSIEILVGRSDGGFRSVNTAADVPSPSDVVVADFDGDGVGEVAIANLFASDPDQGSQYRLPSTVTIIQPNIASKPVFLSGNTLATVDFAFPSANPDLLLDVNGDMSVTPADALAVINGLNRTSFAEGENRWDRFRLDTDVDRDGLTTPRDALLIINRLNRRELRAEGESALASFDYQQELERRRREQERTIAVDTVLTDGLLNP